MTLNPHDKLPTIPDTMPDYTEAEKELARQKQAEAKKQAEVEKPKPKMSRVKKLGLTAAGGLLLGSSFTAYVASGLGGGDTEPKQEPGVSGPEVPGNGSDTTKDIFVDTAEAGFYGEVPAGFETPITLTDSEVATLQSEDYASSRVIYDKKLVPVMNAAVTALLANGGKAEGLNFSNVINDENTISQLVELVSPYAQYGDDQILQLCDTQPNDDGSRNFCSPIHTSGIGLNKDIEWAIHGENASNPIGDEKVLETAMQPRIYEGSSVNKLIVATDGAIRSDF